MTVRVVFLALLCLFFSVVSCSKDRPAPVAPAGKASASLADPSAPTNLRFEAITDTSARFRWDAVAAATDYDINYKKAQGGRWTNWPHRGTELYSTLTGLEPGTEYRWAVRAENRDGPSNWVFGENFTTLGGPDLPTKLRITDLTETSVKLRWDAVAAATDYDINYKKAQGGRWTNWPHRGTELYSTLTGLEPGTEYRWAVRAETDQGPSAWVYADNFTTLSDNQSRDEGGDGAVSDDHGNTRSEATDLPLDSSLAGEIETGEDVDYFRVQVGAPGVLTLGTTGSLDTKGRLESHSGAHLASDDDGGSGNNFSIAHPVSAGTYYVRVASHSILTGSYTIIATVRSAPTDEPEEQPESEGDADDEPDQKEPDDEEPTEPEKIDYDGVISDQEALETLYDATGGFIFWENTTNWNSNAPLDQWYGVDTDGSGRVIRLDLSGNNGLLGEIPPSIGQLKKLEVLDLSDNLLIGILPKELGQLENLEVLNLSFNLMEGAIPAELGQLENLRVLDLSVNLFAGRIPTELENLRNLETFRIGGYGLSEYTGCLPSHFRNIPNNDIGTLWVDVPFCSGGAGKIVASDQGPSRSERATMLRIKQERFAQVRTERQ